LKKKKKLYEIITQTRMNRNKLLPNLDNLKTQILISFMNILKMAVLILKGNLSNLRMKKIIVNISKNN